MNIKKTLLNAMLVLVTAGTLAACDQDSDEGQVEDTMSSAGDTIEQTIDNVGDTMTDAGNAVEDACEEVKEGMDTTNTNC